MSDLLPGLCFSGSSDDIITLEGIIEDELNPQMGQPHRFIVGEPEASPGVDAHGVVVVMEFSPDSTDEGVWAITVLPIAEGVPCPWDVTLSIPKGRGAARVYSPVLCVRCPAGTPVRSARGAKDGEWYPSRRWDASGEAYEEE